MMKLLFIAAGAFAGGAAAAAETMEISAKAAEKLARYEPTGVTENCVMMRQLDSIKAVDDRQLLVEMANGRLYLNVPNGACTGADRANRRLEFRTVGTQLCRGDIVTIVDNSGGFFTGSCSLGAFEELREKAPPPAAAD